MSCPRTLNESDSREEAFFSQRLSPTPKTRIFSSPKTASIDTYLTQARSPVKSSLLPPPRSPPRFDNFLLALYSFSASGVILVKIFKSENIIEAETSGSFNLDALDSAPPVQFECIPLGDLTPILPASSELVIDSDFITIAIIPEPSFNQFLILSVACCIWHKSR